MERFESVVLNEQPHVVLGIPLLRARWLPKRHGAGEISVRKTLFRSLRTLKRD